MEKHKPQNTPKGYHHGDLRNALIVAAAQLIEEKGTVDFTMVEAARRAGVSSAAPYRHFKDRGALLEAVSDLAFLALGEEVRDMARANADDSTAALIALGKAYITFVTGHPAFYDLMWGTMGLQRKGPDNPQLEHSGFYVLMETVERWCGDAGLRDYKPLELTVKLWAIGHGLACLAMNNNIETFLPLADVHGLFESSANTFLDGLRRDVSN